MTRDEVIALAREAGFADGVVEIVGLEGFSRFFDLARAWEREECAKVCEEIEMQGHALWDRTADPDAQGRATGAMDCAAAIRSRT